MTLPLRPRQNKIRGHQQTLEAAKPLAASIPRPPTPFRFEDNDQERASGVLEPPDDSGVEDLSPHSSVKDKGKQRATDDLASLETASTSEPSLQPAIGYENHNQPTEVLGSFDGSSITGSSRHSYVESQSQSNGRQSRKNRKKVRFAEVERVSEQECRSTDSLTYIDQRAFARSPDPQNVPEFELGLLLRAERGQFRTPALLPSLWELPKQDGMDRWWTRKCLRISLFWGSVFVAFVLTIWLMTAWSMATA